MSLLRISEGISVRFVDAGHILGSASIEVFLEEEGIEKKIVFSGDIGNTDQPIIKDPQCIRVCRLCSNGSDIRG